MKQQFLLHYYYEAALVHMKRTHTFWLWLTVQPLGSVWPRAGWALCSAAQPSRESRRGAQLESLVAEWSPPALGFHSHRSAKYKSSTWTQQMQNGMALWGQNRPWLDFTWDMSVSQAAAKPVPIDTPVTLMNYSQNTNTSTGNQTHSPKL